MPVVEGVAAAVALAESLVTLKLQTSKFGDLAAPPAKLFTGEFARYSR
jgi:allantoin racemase